ncbi:penicillin-binding protein 2 [Parabacteroides sp. FAFU027]|uniref:penicillin-binding protein 2 n=1 Tax=Parabacteroides sp. FAFU027 TaxID=2922715 RepID=UPI001FAEEBEA|nr:penicillin-binding protein 2 [Parabacteroides sp. FAFU027]
MNVNHDFDNRRYFIAGAAVFVALIFIARLIFLQIISNDYKKYADSNAFLKKTIYPSRGLLYDRNGKLLVFNKPTYDIMVVLREVQDFDTIDFCRTIGYTKKQFLQRVEDIKDRKKNPGYSAYTPQLFMTQLTMEEYGALQEKLYKFPGFFIQNRSVREYTAPMAAHLFGSMAEVNERDLENDPYYVQGDYTGRSGVEKFYENQLRGTKGFEILLRDAYGRLKGKYEDGKYDQAPKAGRNLKLTVDADLQQYGEMLMSGKLGSIVAIEPTTGEVLAIVSAPNFDPALMNGKQRGKNYAALERDANKPLFNRPLMAAYPPGSTFKTTQGLMYQQEGIISSHTMFPCNRGFAYGSHKLACHAHPSPLDLPHAIGNSCNAYFCYGLRNMLHNRRKYPNIQEAFTVWKDHMVKMGFGYKLGIDLPSEKRGMIPNSKFYNKIYGKKGWRAETIISISIGQGEVLATPLQICNLAASIANSGYYVTPHVVKQIQDTVLEAQYRTKHFTGINPAFYGPIREGMAFAVQGGTARVANLPGIEICGKTGTAQNPHGEDHSIFMAFAPKDHPKIAIAVYVENAGFGADFAAPIGSLLIEKYLKKEIAPNRIGLQERLKNTIISVRGIKKYKSVERTGLVDSTHVSAARTGRVD